MPVPSLWVKGYLKFADGTVSPDVPLDYIIKWIKSNMIEYGASVKRIDLKTRCLVIKSGTGSAKSTALPVSIFRIFRPETTPRDVKYTGKSVICTQPKVVTAVTLATNIPRESWATGMHLGETIGFNTGGAGKLKPPAGLIYATAGILSAQLNLLEDDQIMQMYSVIIIDEAHQRSLDNDALLSMLKNFYIRNAGNKNLPFLILASATFDPFAYVDYFGIERDNILVVEGLPAYPIKTIWGKDSTDYIQFAVDVVKQIVTANADTPLTGDILIFFTGEAEFRDFSGKIGQEYLQENNIMLLNLSSNAVNLSNEDFRLIYEDYENLPLLNGRPISRRLILSTNVAETGVTIKSLGHIIDAGMIKTKEYYQPDCMGLTTKPASKSNIIQRRGRVGRKFPGTFHPLYSEATYELLIDQQLPEIMTTDYSSKHLLLVREQLRHKRALGEKNPIFRAEDLTLLDPPPTEQFQFANAMANQLGFMHNHMLTPIGEIACKMSRGKMEAHKMVLSALLYDVAIHDAITLFTIFTNSITTSSLLDRKLSYEKRNPKQLPIEAIPLRYALPNFIINRVYMEEADTIDKLGGRSDRPKIPDTAVAEEEYFVRCRSLIADTAIECLIVYEAFLYNLNQSIELAENYCKQAKLDLNIMMDLHKARCEYAEDFIAHGINPTINASNKLYIQTISTFMTVVKNIKQCIYEGYKCHMFTLTNSGLYRNLMGQEIDIKPLIHPAFMDRMKLPHMPKFKYIITDTLQIELLQGMTYKQGYLNVSVMDVL